MPETKEGKGKVKWFNELKHYGFIERENDKDLFVHSNDVVSSKTLAIGDEVVFEIEQTDKGLKAVKVKIK